MSRDAVDFLLVGLGLAGGLLAWELSRRGAKLRVVDDNHRENASLVAAGLVTPVTGKRLVLQDNAETLLVAGRARYDELAWQFGQEFFHPMPLLRLFDDETERGYFSRRRSDPAYTEFVGAPATAVELAAFHAPCGGVWFQQTGYLDTPALIGAIRDWLDASDRLSNEPVEYGELAITNEGARWGHIHAHRIIFCEGYRAVSNPWFGYLPWQPAKGEILHLRFEHPPILPDAVINWGRWLAPRRDGSYRLGATHAWAPLECHTTAEGRRALLDSLHARVPGAKVRVVRKVAAVRPATQDRRPFVGNHPAEPALSIFNGFGAKGSLLVPWYAKRMADYLCDGKRLPPDADISRHGS